MSCRNNASDAGEERHPLLAALLRGDLDYEQLLRKRQEQIKADQEDVERRTEERRAVPGQAAKTTSG
jgi:hypothetical protein